MKKKKIKTSLVDRVFLSVDHVIMVLLLIVTLYPLLYVVVASFAAGSHNVTLYLIPKRLSLEGYKTVLEYKDLWVGYANSLINMALQVVVSLTVTVFLAYPLSRPEFKARNFIMVLCMITMYFGGGLIPNYLLMRDLNLLGNRWALILPGALSVYNMIMVRTYMSTSIPGEIRESAQLDGCGNIRYLFSMVLPLSTPILAVIALFVAVSSWNSYFDALVYVGTERSLYPLALILREILVMGSTALDNMDPDALLQMEERRTVMKYALIVVSTLPVMVAYPFVQKYFVKGIMIGSVKG